MIGATLSHYRITAKLGEGGMGEVYRAHDERLDREVAIKVLPEAVAEDPDRLGRFKREAKAVARLSHPNILEIHELGEHEGRPFLVTELLAGETLQKRLKGGALGWRKAAEVGAAIADGLAAAHRAGIVHRDVKPANVFLTADGRIKILDFGLARHQEIESPEGGTEAPTLTRQTEPGTTLGTVGYMAPEQVRGETADQRADVFSLGCVLYEAVSGRGPFQQPDPAGGMAAILRDDPPPLSAASAQVPAAFERLIKKCLEKRPEDRWQSAAEVAGSLRTLAEMLRDGVIREQKPSHSIVVLPFTNLSLDPENEYFADGLTEEITQRLSKIGSLRVISRTSAMRLKGSEDDIPSIGRRLQVSHVLEGSVRKASERLRITAQLIEVTTDSHIWSEQYPGTVTDIFEIQESVAQSIVEALSLSLTADEKRQLTHRPIDNVRAYELYLRARAEIWKWTEDSLGRALALIEDGLGQIGRNEHLLAAKGLVYWGYINGGLIAPGEYEHWLQRTEGCAAELMAAYPGSAGAHYLKAIALNKRGRQQEAVRELNRTLARDPHHRDALFFQGMFYLFSGKSSAAQAMIGALRSIDPLDPWAHVMSGWIEYMDGDLPAALDPCRKAYEMDPDDPTLCWLCTVLLAGNALLDEAFEIVERMEEEMPDYNHTRQALFLKSALQGDKKQAVASVTPELVTMARWDEVWPWAMAAGYALIDEKHTAMDWLERATSRGFIHYPFLSQHDPFLEPLRGEERFRGLMEKVKHEWEHFEV